MRTAGLLVTIAIVLAVFAPQLGAPLELQDDHRIIQPGIRAVPGAFAAWIGELRADVHGVGRFRPVNQIFDVFGPRVLGTSALRWRVVLLALAAAVTALLFQIAYRLYHDAAAAATFALVTMLAPDPGPTSAWYRLGPKEAWGMLFLCCAIVAMIHRRDVVALVFAALCVYSKESFLLLAPALFCLRVWLDVRETQRDALAVMRERWVLAIAYSALFGAGLVFVLIAVRSAGTGSYGGSSLAISGATVTRVLVRDALRAPLLAAGFVPALLAAWAARTRRGRALPRMIAALLFLAWVVPQFALYATRGGFWDFYWLPCVVAFAGVNAAGIAFLATESRALYRLSLAFVAVWTLNAIRTDVTAVVNFKEKARVQQEAVRLAAEHVAADRDLVIVADADVQSELAFAFADFVRARGGRYARAFVRDSRCDACPLRDPWTSKPVATTANPNVLVRLDESRVSPMPEPAFTRLHAMGERVYLSLRKARPVTIPFDIPVEVRAQ